MKIYEYAPGNEIHERTAVALGYFDGVHAGHRRLLATAKKAANERGLLFTVFTFYTEKSVKDDGIIYSTEEKLTLFESLGVEAVIVASFSDICKISAEKFVKDCLYKDMGCRAAVAGFDFGYGAGRKGNAETLKSDLKSLGVDCIIEPEHKIDGEKISSTKIKKLLADGKVDLARKFLGYPYQLICEVERGRGVGKKLGFPTVNTKIDPSRAQLSRGVYRTAVVISEKLYTGVTNVGTCPTFEERAVHAETYIVDYNGSLYGERIKILFLGRIRDEKKFESQEELIMQINVDKNKAIEENGELTWQAIGQN